MSEIKTRARDQAVEAFSAPRDLLARAKARAAELGMTKSGYFRYSLALELGYTREEAELLGEHRQVSSLRDSLPGVNYGPTEGRGVEMNDRPEARVSEVIDEARKALSPAELEAAHKPIMIGRKKSK